MRPPATKERVEHSLDMADVAAMMAAEMTLYHLLGRESGDVYGRYNSLLRRLASFERSLDRALSA